MGPIWGLGGDMGPVWHWDWVLGAVRALGWKRAQDGRRHPPVPGVAVGLQPHLAEAVAAVFAHQAVRVDAVRPVLPHQARRHLDLWDGLAVQQLGGGT